MFTFERRSIIYLFTYLDNLVKIIIKLLIFNFEVILMPKIDKMYPKK